MSRLSKRYFATLKGKTVTLEVVPHFGDVKLEKVKHFGDFKAYIK